MMITLATNAIITLASISLILVPFPRIVDSGIRNPPSTTNLTSHIIFVGDTGSGDSRQIKVAGAIKNYCQSRCNFGVIVGDVIYNSGVTSVSDAQFISKFETPYAGTLPKYYIAYGNHDYLGCTQCYIDYSRNSDLWEMPSRYYKIHSDNVDIFVIDTEKFNFAQALWLTFAVGRSTAPHKIVAGHKPIITYEDTHGGEYWSGRALLRSIICNNAEYYIAGHSHLLELNNIDGCSAKQIVAGGGGAATRKMANKTAPVFYHEGLGFLDLQATSSNTTINFVDENGKILFTK